MKTVLLLCTAGLGLVLSSAAQSTIAYFHGPSFPIPTDGSTVNLDLNLDGTADLSFAGGPFVCTADVPTSGCSGTYYGSSLNGNEIEVDAREQAAPLPAGTLISSVTFSNAVWTNSDGATLFGFFFSPRYGTSAWYGPFSTPGSGFFGFRFHAADGLHYGWGRAELSNPGGGTNAFEESPMIIDWAFETRTNTAIAAGARPIPVPPSGWQIIAPETLRLSWQSESNQTYQLQFKQQLDAALWTNVGAPVLAAGSNATADAAAIGSTGFYRVVKAD